MPHTKLIEVRFRDVDMLQHVNNAVYLNYLEEARFSYWRQLHEDEPLAGINFILGTVTIRYVSPALLGETLAIKTVMQDMRRSSFTMAYEITSTTDDRIVATAETIQVMYDYEQKASCPIPDSLRARIGAFEGRTY